MIWWKWIMDDDTEERRQTFRVDMLISDLCQFFFNTEESLTFSLIFQYLKIRLGSVYHFRSVKTNYVKFTSLISTLNLCLFLYSACLYSYISRTTTLLLNLHKFALPLTPYRNIFSYICVLIFIKPWTFSILMIDLKQSRLVQL